MLQKKHHNSNCCCVCFLLFNTKTTTGITKNKNVNILPLSKLIFISEKKILLKSKKNFFWCCHICVPKAVLFNHHRKLNTNTFKAFLFKYFLKTWLFVFCFTLFTMLILTPISQNQVLAVSLKSNKNFMVETSSTITTTTAIKIDNKKTIFTKSLTSDSQIRNYFITSVKLSSNKIKYIKKKNLLTHHLVRRSDINNENFINDYGDGAFISSNYNSYNNGFKKYTFHYQVPTIINNQRQNFNGYSHRLPYNVILILPSRESDNDKFGLTSEKARPVIDISIEDIILTGQMPNGWINITYHDSRYWEDTLLAERHSTFGVVQAYCENRLDTILGFADAYSLATVSKISAGFGDGVPVITTTGLNSQIGSKKSYPYVTRMTGSYIQMAESLYRFIAYHSEDIHNNNINNQKLKLNKKNYSQTNLNYKNLVFMYHDKRRAINRPPIQGSKGEIADDFISSHCYFSLHAIKSYFKETSEHFKESWKFQTPHVAFDEELPRTRVEVIEWVKMASKDANG